MRDISGKSGMEMLTAIVNGENDPIVLSHMAKGRAIEKIPELQRALKGSIGYHQRQMLKHQLEHIAFLSEQIDKMDEEIKKKQNLPKNT